ncbi:hypothetical protein VP01_13551g1 [Puccinia sorghi]|uniref:Uncharacterized protein n=1 Tax=Puccinia sorghi TaxID=27349 RepID=A0A0L6VM23_9BASI|nr:hypothetical protein VP01_13551g1 [Puccinia sorghi]
MLISNLTSSPDGLSLNLKTILKQIHGLRTYVCFSPQRSEQFKAVVDFAQPNLHEISYNFTFLNIDQAIDLHQSCDHFCNENAEVFKFKLTDSKAM